MDRELAWLCDQYIDLTVYRWDPPEGDGAYYVDCVNARKGSKGCFGRGDTPSAAILDACRAAGREG